MNKYRKSDDLPKERQPLSLLSSTPADACAYDQVDGGNLAQCVEPFEGISGSSSWVSLKRTGTSAMERLGQTLEKN